MDLLTEDQAIEFSNSIGLFVELQAQKARLDAEIIKVLGRISAVIDDAIDAGPQDAREAEQTERALCIEAGAPARIHDHAMSSMVNKARPFIDDFPLTLEALGQAKISLQHAYAIVNIGADLLTTAHQRKVYEAHVVPRAKELTTNQLRPIARRVAQRLTEKTIDQRHKEEVIKRDVWVNDAGDGMANLVAYLPAPLAFAIRERLGEMALAADPTGRNIAQIRTDIFTDLLLTGHAPAHRAKAQSPALGSDPLFPADQADSGCPDCSVTEGSRGLGSIQAHISITIPLLTLLPKSIADVIRQTPGFEHVAGLEGACELVGYGPIDSKTAFFLAGNASGWDRILTHPVSGTPLRTDRYTPSQEIKRTLKIRDQHCRFPGCRMSTIRCENDHTIPWSRGGPTEINNLAYLCRYHHVFKHKSGWQVTQSDNGTLTWTSTLGQTYTTEPPSNNMYAAMPHLRSGSKDEPIATGATSPPTKDPFPDLPPF